MFDYHHLEVCVCVRGVPALNVTEVDHKIIHTIQSQKVYKRDIDERCKGYLWGYLNLS